MGDSLRVKKIHPASDTRTSEELIGALKDFTETELGLDREHFAICSGRLNIRKHNSYNCGVTEVLDGRLTCDNPDHWMELSVFNLVVTVGLEFVVDAFQNIVELENMNFHAVGTGTTAPVVGDTALEIEDLMGNANRPAGTQGENTATVYQTVATITNNSGVSKAITEAGILSANAAGVLLSRQTFSAVNLAAGDSIETTWEYTIS